MENRLQTEAEIRELEEKRRRAAEATESSETSSSSNMDGNSFLDPSPMLMQLNQSMVDEEVQVSGKNAINYK